MKIINKPIQDEERFVGIDLHKKDGMLPLGLLMLKFLAEVLSEDGKTCAEC